MNFKTKIEKKAKLYTTKRKIKSQQNFYENMINSSSGKATDIIFNKTSLAWLIVIVTFLLQLISLATTYKGSIVYFGGISLPFNISAPLLFAISIQLIVFCVSHTIRSNFKKGLMVVLLMATVCSTYFSYIGIYNYINSPINYLEERYKQITSNLSDKYQVIQENTKGNMSKTMISLINEISKLNNSLSLQVSENQKLSEEISNIDIESGVINSQTSTVTMPNIYDYGNNLDGYYADMAKYNAAIGNMISDSVTQDSSLQTQLYNAKVEAILGGKTHEEFIANSIDTQSKKASIEKAISNLSTLIGSDENSATDEEKLASLQDYCQNFIQGLGGEKENFTNILLNLNAQTLLVNDTNLIPNLQDQINEFLVINNKDAELIKPLASLEKTVYENSTGKASSTEIILTEKDAMELYSLMNSEINSAIYTLNQISINDTKIDPNATEYVMHNLYILPVYNLIQNSDTRSMAWFCLLFAILIDGLTLIFAIMEGRENTPLFAKSTKEIMGTSKDSMENLLILALLSGDTECKDEKRVQTVLLKLKLFISQFTLLTETLDNGYSMYCPINKVNDYQIFLATLCQFNLATIITSKELFINKSPDSISDENYVLIKSKFVVWANEKIVSLTLNNQYIDSLNDINEDFITNGELL